MLRCERECSRLVISGILVASAMWEVPAAAQAPTDRALADTLFREGREAMDRSDFATACPKFAESYRLDRALGTILNLALCHEKQGKVVTAWTEFSDAAEEAHRTHDDRESYARKHIATLEAMVPRVYLALDPANESLASLEIKVDHAVVGRAAWSAALPVEPGSHEVEAAAPGKATWTAPFEISAGNTVKIEVPRLNDVIVAPPPPETNPTPLLGAPGVPPTPAPYMDARPPDEPSGGTQRTVGWIVGGVGVAGVAVGAIFGLRALSLKSDRDAHCFTGNVCDVTGVAKDDDARTAATISTVGFVAGAALIAGGVALVLTAPRIVRGGITTRVVRVGTGTGVVFGGEL